MTLLQCKSLRAGYGKVQIVHDFDVSVGAGEILAVLGPNGSGKTTLLSTIAGILPRLGGEILLDGEKLPSGNPVSASRRGLVLVPDDRALFSALSVSENIEVARRRGSEPAKSVLEFFPALEKRWDVAAGALSGGEAQMLAMARALIQQPRILLIDEMSMGLAPVIVEQLLIQVREIVSQRSTAVVLVEQHVALAFQAADKVIVVAHGTSVLSGAAEDVSRDMELVSAAYLGGASQ